MQLRFSPIDWAFVAFFLLVLATAGVAYLVEAQDTLASVVEVMAYFVAAAVFVNLVRYWRSVLRLQEE